MPLTDALRPYELQFYTMQLLFCLLIKGEKAYDAHYSCGFNDHVPLKTVAS